MVFQKKTRGEQREQLEKERKDQLKMDPLAACERQRSLLSMKVDQKLNAVGKAVGDEAIDRALHSALAAWRQFVGFSHEMFSITGRAVYEVRSTLHQKFGSESLQRRLKALRPSAQPIEKPSREVLEALRASWPKPQQQIFEGENEWREHLEKNNLIESAPPDIYKPRRIFPSPD